MNDSVALARSGEVLIVTIQNPPVNALGHAVRLRLRNAIAQAQSDRTVRAVVLVGAGAVFSAGADIREFGMPRQPPLLAEVCDAIEALDKPVVAAIHGAALGGGLELALAAHDRVLGPNAVLALPEVLLGLMPGAGATQRAPRLIGAQAALDLMLGGQRLSAQEALRIGLVDALADDPLAQALSRARGLAAQESPLRRSRDASALEDRAAAQAAIQAARVDVARRRPQLVSPARILDAVEAAVQRPFDEGLALEAEGFLACLQSPQREALVHVFMAERALAKSPEATAATPVPLRRVGVVGAGTMGAGIAVAVLNAGLPVTLVERDESALARGLATIAGIDDGLLRRGRLSQQEHAERRRRLQAHVHGAALADADLVIEAAFEDMAVKKAVFAELARVCKPGAVLASNTSYLDIDEIAASTPRAQDVIGLHFFSPAHVMKLLEIVVPQQASAAAVATGFELARRLGKVAVRAGVCEGFIGNRMLAVYRRAAEIMVEDGVSPYDVDAAVRDFGFAMGPFQVMDLAGGDIAWATRRRRAALRPDEARVSTIADQLCERGWFGQKTGRGWYRYEAGDRRGVPDAQVLDWIDQQRRRAGRPARALSAQAIVQRYLAAMINEGANVVHEGIARRPLDVDVVLVNGYGFPRHCGGPMFHADRQGLRFWLDLMRTWETDDPRLWRPSRLLVDLAQRGGTFADLNRRASADALPV